jgi:hypothetical protein
VIGEHVLCICICAFAYVGIVCAGTLNLQINVALIWHRAKALKHVELIWGFTMASISFVDLLNLR